MSNDTTLNRQWISRPDDQRFLTMAELGASVRQRRVESWTTTPAIRDIGVHASNGEVNVTAYDPTEGKTRTLTPTNFAFAQLAGYAGAPASYLRKLPADLAAINLQYGIDHNAIRDDALILGRTNGHNEMRALTSTSYGRIWDAEVVAMVDKINDDGRWEIPSASYMSSNPKRATTLYASDRDVFVFLCDPKNPIEVKGETLFRGFYTWNSEVGAATFGLSTFLYRYVCDNRIIWGQTDVKELRIRHTGGAPERFAYEGQKYLRNYADESTAKIAHTIEAAKGAKVPVNPGMDKGFESWLQSRGFTLTQARGAKESAIQEEGQAETVWDAVQGLTSYARTIPHTDERVKLEASAGRLLDLAV